MATGVRRALREVQEIDKRVARSLKVDDIRRLIAFAEGGYGRTRANARVPDMPWAFGMEQPALRCRFAEERRRRPGLTWR